MELTIRLPDETLEWVREMAAIADVTPEAYVADLLRTRMADEWADADAALAHYDRTGEFVAVEEALGKFERDVKAGLAAHGRKSA